MRPSSRYLAHCELLVNISNQSEHWCNFQKNPPGHEVEKNYSLSRIYGIILLLYCILNLCYYFSLNVYFQEEYWKIEVNVKLDHVKNCGRNWGHLFRRKEG